MAKIVITIKDEDGGHVNIQSNPDFKTLKIMADSGKPMTPAHGYALSLINKAMSISNEFKESKRIIRKP